MANYRKSEGEDYVAMITEEFKTMRYSATAAEIAKLAQALEVEEVEFGEMGVTAACIGYWVAMKRFK